VRDANLLTPLSTIVEGSGPGLLLAHGGGGSIQNNFGILLPLLSRHFTVIGPDYPGSGKTPYALESLNLDELADQLVATAVDAGIERFAMLGYSLGCAVAIRAAIRHPERITALVLTAGFARLDEASRLRAQVLQALAEGKHWDLLSRSLVGSLIHEGFLTNLSTEQRESFVKRSVASIPVGFAEQIDLVIRTDVRDDLPHISVPTLVIHMAHEHLVSPQTGKDLDLIPRACVAKLESGHFPIDQSYEWFHFIQWFLLEEMGHRE
jgi:pimeloyl-ACP methyl ester carboxylesterase